MDEAITKIPGTTYSLKFGVEGKYYSVFLCRGNHPFKSKPLSIMKGTTLRDLPEELEKGLQYLLDSEQLYLSPIIIDRVVNDLLDRIPDDGQVFVKETSKPIIEEPTVHVSEMISKSEQRAEKKSIIEHTPSEKSKFDASAMDIGKIQLRTPRPLPQKEVTSISEPIIESQKTPYTTPTSQKDSYQELEEKVSSLTSEVKSLHEIIESNKKAISNLKGQITKLNNKLKE
ncbi:MAG: hypothetical protein FK734_20945 [Asgard group archaeon]|nr:hypothetical protein [Asgard group archaeon]